MRIYFLCAVLFFLSGPPSAAADKDFAFFPGTQYDPSVPALDQVVGHAWAERISTHAECERYLQALAQSSARARLFTYGSTWEGRNLYYLVIGTPDRLERLEPLKADLRALAHPLSLGESAKRELVAKLPVVTWIACNIHGNEPSSTDACLFLAYHLLAARGDSIVDNLLSQSIVVIDPMENPDGHDRFVNYSRGTAGRWPAEDPAAAERREPWPGGRTNHYLFDMNRDWFAMTQLESQGRVAAYLDWCPHLFLDLHEMESDASYYFPPTAPPLNPRLSRQQLDWFAVFGKNNAAWFDRYGFKYWTGEVFDAFFPGYGCSWPSLQGSIGMTYEQASSRGLAVRRSDQTVMPYLETVRHHLTAALASADLAARNRQRLLQDYLATRIPPASIPVNQAYLIPTGPDPSQARKLVALLLKQGVAVTRAAAGFECRSLVGSDSRKVPRMAFPAGTYVVKAAQEAHALAANLLETQINMDEEFIREQERRKAAGLGDQIYDITAWSLPLLWGVDCYRTDDLPGLDCRPVTGESLIPAPEKKQKADLAYILDGGQSAVMAALADLLRLNLRVLTSDLPFSQNGRKFSRGSLILPVKENDKNLPEILAEIEKKYGLEFYPTFTGWMSEGVNFGSPNVHFLPRPAVLLVWDSPASSYSAGWCRYVLERQFGVPVTTVKADDLNRIELYRYNVLIFPSGGNYGASLKESGLDKINKWAGQGGTLIGIGGAAAWFADPEVKLLDAGLEYRLDEDSVSRKKAKAEDGKTNRVPGSEIKSLQDLDRAVNDERRGPASMPGVAVRLRLDPDHWLTCGYDSTAVCFAEGSILFAPLTRSQGRNVAFFDKAENLLLSGYAWKGPSLRQMAFKPYLLYRPLGQGHVICFAEDPNFRAVCDGMNRLFLNAVLLGPAH